MSMDMKNPRVLYAAFWDHQRLPWYVRSGGKGSSIWKSTDGGDTWKKLSNGLPTALMGKIGISVSMANPQRVYAIIESDEGGLFRSEDGGNTFALINGDRMLRACIQLIPRCDLHNHTEIHHCDPLTNMADHREIMCYKNGRKT